MCVSAVLSCGQILATPWTVAHQAALSMGFSRKKYRSELSFPAPGDLPNLEIESASLVSPALQADSFLLCHLTYLQVRDQAAIQER